MNFFNTSLIKLRFLLWARVKANFYPSFNFSHSQFGEDMVVRFLTNDRKKGFYIDIGAHHPVYISNTYHFYCKGWQGINIDATPGSMDIFNILRPRDLNLEACLSATQNKEIEFFIFEQPAYNTFNKEMAETALLQGIQLLEKKKLKTMSLEGFLDLYLPEGVEIDFLSVDIEGMDEEILMSNNWNRYKPKIVIFEKHHVSLKEIENLEIINHLAKYDYQVVAKCGPSLILKLNN